MQRISLSWPSFSNLKMTRWFVACVAMGAATAVADIRILHLSPDAPSVDVNVGIGSADAAKETLLSEVPFTGVSPYIATQTGENYFIDVVPTGGITPVLTANFFVEDSSNDFSIAAVNVVDSIEPLILPDDNTIDPAMARLRVVHASPDAGPVDVSVDGLGTVLTNFDFKDTSPYLSVPGGDYTVRISPVGSDAEIVVPDVSLETGTVYSAFAAGLLNGSGDQAFRLLPTVDAVPEPSGLALLMIAAFALTGCRRRSHS